MRHYTLNFIIRSNVKWLVCFFCCIWLLPGTAFSQVNSKETLTSQSNGLRGDAEAYQDINYRELGIPYIQNYSPEEYSAGPDNWAAVQSREGIMYFGNKFGVLEYDGVSWRLIQLPNQGIVRSLAIDQDNKIFVGGANEIGFLAADSIGQMQFVSLKDKLDPSYHNFQNVWFTHLLNGNVYFKTPNYLIRWDGNEFRVWEPNGRYRFSKVIQNKLYLVEEGVGLRKVAGDTLQTVLPETTMNGARIYGLVPHQDDQMLALTLQKGLFLISENSISPFQSPINTFLKDNWGYQLLKLPNGWYSIATLNGGVVVIDKDGEVVQYLNQNFGIADNSVYYQFVDQQHGLWLTTSDGISRAELLSPYTIYDERLGVESFVNDVHRYEGVLYAASNEGILYLDEGSSVENRSRFVHIENTLQAFDLLTVDESLFVAANSGVYQMTDHKIVQTFDYGAASLLRSEINPGRIYIGLGDGFALLKQIDGKWTDGGRIEGINDDIRNIVEDNDGTLWLESQVNGVWRVEFPDVAKGELSDPSIKHFRANIELPSGTLFLRTFKDQPIFEIEGQVYKYDAGSDSIMIDVSMAESLGMEGEIAPKIEDEHGNLWMYAQLDTGNEAKFRAVAVAGENGRYTIKNIDDERVTHNTRKVLFPEDNGIVWYGGADGIVRHDTRIAPDSKQEFQPLIRKITTNDDSLVFGGAQDLNPYISLPYESNNLRFEFAASSFDDESANQFQFYLDGFDEDWSAWTQETQKDYTNIPEGDYIFRLRAKNIYGTESSEATFGFVVLPPWYRTWWAYGIYVFVFLGFVMAIVRWRSYKLQKEKEALQKIVSERTEQVKKQAEQLKELDEAKSRFFANISHEFRTPLTLILGQVQQLESGSVADNPEPVYQMIKRNGQRVLGLVNQLLELSTLESGNMKLKTVKTDLIAFLQPIVAAYDSLAESKGIQFDFEPGIENLPIYLDRDKIEKVLQNVISNAFKFTPEEGRITVSVVQDHAEGSAEIRVEDNGAGIDSDELDKIFDRFYRGKDSTNKNKEGSGIGLALAKELVTLHKGTISVESKVGQGTCFIITLPLGKAHLKEDEIMSESMIHSEQDDSQLPEHQTLKKSALKTDAVDTGEDKEEMPQVLVVEDNDDMRQYIRQILQSRYQVVEAFDGSEGLEKAVEKVPDLVISDVMMPGMDGMELCEKLKNDERTSHIPVVLLTAKAGKDAKIEGLEHHADDYLTKPFDTDELLVLLKNRIEQRALLRERFSREVMVQPKDIAITSADERFLRRAIGIVEENMDDFDFNVESFVDQMHMGRTQFNKKLKALTDLTPVQFIRSLRLKRAAQKITEEEDTISQIAYSVGFNNLSYFAKCFKDQFGESPSNYVG
ncbi:MAG: response regulator [Bacteroidetes bacterium]|nr:response regulator [Bacteroidota bacterium]